jgi:hypothetical protein
LSDHPSPLNVPLGAVMVRSACPLRDDAPAHSFQS